MGKDNIIINDHSEEVTSALEEAIRKALKTVGELGEGYAKKLCPVDSGLLRNSITNMQSGESFNHNYSSDDGSKTGNFSGTIGDKEEKAVYIGTNVEYAPYIEMGTSKTSPQPFLKPSATDHIDTYKKVLEKEIKEALKD